ncbi:MAG: hypothetical protein WB809_01320 [Thermoplasmata archaeon]
MEPAPRRRSRARLIVLVVVVVLIVGVVGFLFYEGSQTITVTSINFTSPDDTCGLDGASFYGFNDTLSDTVQLGFPVQGNNTTSGGTSACTIHTVTTPTGGFSIASANTPLSIGVNDTSAVLWLNITLPSSAYNGALTLTVT